MLSPRRKLFVHLNLTVGLFAYGFKGVPANEHGTSFATLNPELAGKSAEGLKSAGLGALHAHADRATFEDYAHKCERILTAELRHDPIW
jgi:hypothetical protein